RITYKHMADVNFDLISVQDLKSLQTELSQISPSLEVSSDPLSYRQLDEIQARLKKIYVESKSIEILLAMKNVINNEKNYLNEVGTQKEKENLQVTANRILSLLNAQDSFEKKQEIVNNFKDRVALAVFNHAQTRLDTFLKAVRDGNEKPD